MKYTIFETPEALKAEGVFYFRLCTFVVRTKVHQSYINIGVFVHI